MQTRSKVFLGIGLIIFIIIGFSMSGEKDTSTAVTSSDTTKLDSVSKTETNNEEGVVDVHPATETEVEMADTGNMESLPEAVKAPLVAGVYTEYKPEAVASSQAEHIVLNFSATWCPSCRTLDKNINANLSDIPDGVEIYKVDYDTNVELRKKYGVTTQHTLVVVNPDGTMVKKWSGGSTLSGIVNKL